MQEQNSLAKGLLATGLIVIMIALLWWHAFYRSLAQQYDPGLGEHDPTLNSALACVLYTTNACQSALRIVAEEEGRIAYHPGLFWLGVGIALAGIGIGRYTTRAEGRHSNSRNT